VRRSSRNYSYRRYPKVYYQVGALAFKSRIVSIDAGDAGCKEQNKISGGGYKDESASAFELPSVRLGFNQVGKHLQLLLLPVPSGRGSWQVRQPELKVCSVFDEGRGFASR
jgi:hypothetical protein